MRQSSFSCEFYERFCTRFWNRKILTTAFLFCYLIPKLLYFILIVWLRQYLFGWTNWPCMILKLHSSQRVRKWKIKVKNNDMGIRSFFFTSLSSSMPCDMPLTCWVKYLWHALKIHRFQLSSAICFDIAYHCKNCRWKMTKLWVNKESFKQRKCHHFLKFQESPFLLSAHSLIYHTWIYRKNQETRRTEKL